MRGFPRSLTVTAASRRLASPGTADACYFRSGPHPGHRKALLQITERCDLHCAHCFVSATRSGQDMEVAQLTPEVFSRLAAARVANVTITGGEPLVHPELLGILERLVDEALDVTVCTNGVSARPELIKAMADLQRVKVNVSIDGYAAKSHGRFRGDRRSFEATLENTRRFANAGLLKGILSTPNILADPGEYAELYAFARDLGADYLLMNPLSRFGRGAQTRSRLGAPDDQMRKIQSGVLEDERDAGDPEAVFIRFPNRTRPLTGCIAGDIFYVFVDGETTICPYLVFAARNPNTRHDPHEFIVANLFRDADFAERLDADDFHERYELGGNPTCSSCAMGSSCGKGCPAAVIESGGRIGELDAEACPVVESTGEGACSSP